MALRFLLDEDTEQQLASKLSKAGHDVERVVSVSTLGAGTDDSEILDYASRADRIILTHDKDYVTVPPDTHSGVFYAPNQRLSAHRLYTIVQTVNEAHSSPAAFDTVIFLTEQWLSD
jgi:hypothetical protein